MSNENSHALETFTQKQIRYVHKNHHLIFHILY